MAIFTAGELYDIAVGIERNGIAYYESLAQLASDQCLRETYYNLANMERHHVEVFQMLRSEAGIEALLPQADADEYGRYLQGLIDSTIFANDQVARQMAKKASGRAEALQLALGAEKDSLLFYTEMRELVPARERDAVTKIINEERSHVRQLSELKQRYS